MEFTHLLASYKHKTAIQIRFKDIDKQGHVNNAVYLTYFEIARTSYFNHIFRQKNNWTQTGIILAKAEITYKQPVLLEDTVYCYTKLTRFGTKSFGMEQLLVNETDEEKIICALGKTVLVCMNYETKQTIPVPQEWVKSSNLFEQ